jgi:hypothetical protein
MGISKGFLAWAGGVASAGRCLGLSFCLLHCGVGTAQPSLAPSVQADLLREKIESQAKSNDPNTTLLTLDQYHKLAQDSQLAFPPPLYLIEAKAAHAAGDSGRALSALTEFLHRANQNSEQYKEALALYPQYQQLAAGSGTPPQRLAPDIQADLLREKIEAQAKSNDPNTTLLTLDQYHKLAQDSQLAFPPPLYLIEAKAAHATGDSRRALSALIEFLHRANRNSDQYKEALVLYPQYQQLAAGGIGNR